MTIKVSATLAFALCAFVAPAQDMSRQATMVGSRGDRGKCTIEVEVDGVADVEIRGNQGRIRTLSGQTATWRRFECSDPLPRNPSDFRFSGVDGRGRQTLVQDPRGGRGIAVIRIEDPKSGREGYTFDIEWRGNAGGGNWNDGGWGGNNGGGWGGGRGGDDYAIRACRDAVADRARGMGYRDIEINRAEFDSGPRREWVRGSFFTRGGGRDQFDFACSVDYNGGRVRNVDIRPRGGSGWGNNNNPGQAVRWCQDAANARLNEMGYREANIYEIRPDDGPGRNDWVLGKATARRGSRGYEFTFSCSVDFQNGRVRSIDVRER